MTPPQTPVPETVSELVSSLPRSPPARQGGRLARLPAPQALRGRVPEWTVRVADGRCEVAPGLTGEPTCVVENEGRHLRRDRDRAYNPQVAFMTGRVKVSNIAELMRFVKAFRRCGSGGGGRGPRSGSGKPGTDTSELGLDLPLTGTTVLDLTRMLPGAVLGADAGRLPARG